MAKEPLPRIRDHAMNRHPKDRKIAVAFDGSEGSRRALREAFLMAGAGSHKLSVVFIEELPRYPGAPSETNEERERMDALFEQLSREAATEGLSCGVQVQAEKRVAHPAQGLVQYARDAEIDVLILGHSGHSGLWGTFLGTTADKVVRHAPCSVFVVR
jgi:nucleotide-binding universal stress UspA family protein